jgi:predicted DNA binding CopG/RHH family protein
MSESDRLSADEKEILDSYERGEWRSVEGRDDAIEHYREVAKNTFRKDKRINIRISSRDLNALHVRALEEGIPYQTLASSVLHKYVDGRLTEKSR